MCVFFYFERVSCVRHDRVHVINFSWRVPAEEAHFDFDATSTCVAWVSCLGWMNAAISPAIKVKLSLLFIWNTYIFGKYMSIRPSQCENSRLSLNKHMVVYSILLNKWLLIVNFTTTKLVKVDTFVIVIASYWKLIIRCAWTINQ